MTFVCVLSKQTVGFGFFLHVGANRYHQREPWSNSKSKPVAETAAACDRLASLSFCLHLHNFFFYHLNTHMLIGTMKEFVVTCIISLDVCVM